MRFTDFILDEQVDGLANEVSDFTTRRNGDGGKPAMRVRVDLPADVLQFEGQELRRLCGVAPQIGPQLSESEHPVRGGHHSLCENRTGPVAGILQVRHVRGRYFAAPREGSLAAAREGIEIGAEFHTPYVTKKVITMQDTLLNSTIYGKSNVGEDRRMENVDIRAIRLANLETLLKEISKADLARAMGKKPNYLSHIHKPNGQPRSPIGYAMARSIEAAMKRPAGWMDRDHSPTSTNTDPGVGRTRRVPIIGWDQVRRIGGMDTILDDPMEDTVVIYASDSVGIGAFGLRVRGDSMVDTTNGTGYPDGSIIVVDPTAETLPGDAVVVQLASANDAVFKILEFDGQQRFLKPLNPRYPIAAFPDDAQIIGRVVQVTTLVPPSSRR